MNYSQNKMKNTIENKKLKVYAVNRGDGDWIENSERSNYEEADIVVIPGGSDVHPSWYGHKAIPGVYTDMRQDIKEVDLFNKCIAEGKFIIGICKSSQMATALSGGWLIQHSNHPSRHGVVTTDGKSFMVNSSHHQISYPFDLPDYEYELLAWAQQQANYHLTQDSRQVIFPKISLDSDGLFKEPEAIWYPKIRCFAQQFHIEWGSCSEEALQWCNKWLIELYNRPPYEAPEEIAEGQSA